MKLHHTMFQIGKNGAILLLYGVLFLALTWPACLHLNTHILADKGDGLQMYWNVWWVRHAILTSGLTVFETPLLFYPQIPNLFIHSLHPFGGLLSVPFVSLLGDVALFNLVVLFAFAVSGWGAYLLAKHITGCEWAAFIGGYIFTFSNYHFAHAQGHLNLVLMQWIPFYFFCLYRLVDIHRVRDAVFSAFFLFLVLLCDHYYFLFCCLASLFFVAWGFGSRRIKIQNFRSYLIFIILSLCSSGVFCIHFLSAASSAEITVRDPESFGMDLFALLIPGGHWKFAQMSAPYWERLGGNIHESSVHVGLGVILLSVFGYSHLKKNRNSLRHLLIALATVFALISLGADLQIFGYHFQLPMPYDLLERMLPFIRAGGVPVRFIVITILSLSILASAGASILWSRHRRGVLMLLLGLVAVELLPRPVPTSLISFPPHVEFLANLARLEPGPVLDLAHRPNLAMVYQTRHRQPIQTGYLARKQHAVLQSDAQVQLSIDEWNVSELSRIGFRYVIAETEPEGCQLLFKGGGASVYELPKQSEASFEPGPAAHH